MSTLNVMNAIDLTDIELIYCMLTCYQKSHALPGVSSGFDFFDKIYQLDVGQIDLSLAIVLIRLDV